MRLRLFCKFLNFFKKNIWNILILYFFRPYYGYALSSNPGVISISNVTINSTKLIDGISLTSINNTVSTAEILEGGIGHNFFKLQVVANANFLQYSVTLFENGTYLETREKVYGNIDKEVKLLYK